MTLAELERGSGGPREEYGRTPPQDWRPSRASLARC